MSGVLFGLELVAFVLACWWAYGNDRTQPNLAEKGLLAMKPANPGAMGPRRSAPAWRKALRRGRVEAAEEVDPPIVPGRVPQWKRRLRGQARH